MVNVFRIILALPLLAAVCADAQGQTQPLQSLGPGSWIAPAQAESSSNGAVFAGSDAALVVDPGRTPQEASRLIREATRLTGVPVRYVVLTHWHPDHTLGALCTPDGGFTLVATGPTRKRLAEGDALRGNSSAAPSCRPRLPELIVDGSQILELGGHQIHLIATGHGHTGGDLAVWSARDRTLATGDLFLNRSAPYMEEGQVDGWLSALDRLLRLGPAHIVPGHFEKASKEEMQHFRDYLQTLREQALSQLEAGASVDALSLAGKAPAFSAYRQFPQYNATLDDNLRAVGRQLAQARIVGAMEVGYTRLAELEVGQNPHQISFSADRATAFVAAAGSNQIAVVTTSPPRLERVIPAQGTPLGVLPRGESELVVTRFGETETVAINAGSGQLAQSLETGPGSSLIVPVQGAEAVMVSSEGDNRLIVFDPIRLEVLDSYPTGRRPFPAATTSDGRLAFVPNYDDASVTVIDLWNKRVKATVAVGAQPSGGAVLPGDNEYAVAVRGEDRLVFINTASFEVSGQLSQGIGDSPFSVVVSPDGSRAFVNNTASHDVSLIALPGKRVVARIPTGEIPIVMAVQPDGSRLWVSSEGSHTLSVYRIPPRPQAAGSTGKTEVGVLGMIHGRHRTSQRWGLEQLRATIRKFRPEVVCIEIPPNRWERIWDDYGARGRLADSRVAVFPEYTDVLLPLRAELGYEIEPCAGWTAEMNDLRRTRLQQFGSQERFSAQNAEYTRLRQQARQGRDRSRSDDPLYIHSQEYDAQVKAEYEIYDRYLNDWIGPGGWTNINRAHYALLEQTVEAHPGKRILVTFGAGHKYWILEQLRRRSDVTLLDMRDFLPQQMLRGNKTTTPYPADAQPLRRQRVVESVIDSILEEDG